jgi:hypothetical protein
MKFQLIQQLFRTIFDIDKVIYIWGDYKELEPFVDYEAFIIEQVYLPEFIVSQKQFYKEWTKLHPDAADVHSSLQ